MTLHVLHMIGLLPWSHLLAHDKINADVHIVDKQTPLEIAYDYGNIKVVELLVPQIMIKINARDKLSIIGEHINNLINGYVHNKMGQTQLLYPFQKSKDLKLEIQMACNHCTKFMV